MHQIDVREKSGKLTRQKWLFFSKTYHILLSLGATICIDRTCYMMWCNAGCGFVVIDVNQIELKGTISKAINCLKCETLTSEYEWQRRSCCEFSTFVFHVFATCQKRRNHQKFIHHLVLINIHQQQSYAANRSKGILCCPLFSVSYFKEEPEVVPTFLLGIVKRQSRVVVVYPCLYFIWQALVWRAWSFPLQVLKGGLKQLFLYINIIWIDCTFKIGSFCD